MFMSIFLMIFFSLNLTSAFNFENNEVNLHDGYGNPINSLGGALDIHDADSHDTLINHFVHYLTGDTSVLNGSFNAGDRVIVVEDSTGFVAGSQIDIQNGTKHIHHWRIVTDVTGNNITVDAPLDYDFPNGSVVNEGIANMNVDGSVTPVVFVLTPKEDQVLHLLRMLIALEHSTAADDSLFGDLPALTNGVVIRVSNNGGTSFNTLTTWHKNKDMKEDMYDVTYTDKAGGGNHGTNGRWTWKNVGNIINLDETENEIFQVVIQDDLTSLIDFQIKLQGHPED